MYLPGSLSLGGPSIREFLFSTASVNCYMFYLLCRFKNTHRQAFECVPVLGPEISSTGSRFWYINFHLICNIAVYICGIEKFGLTYLLTPWSRVLLEKLTGSAASQEIPRIFGTRRFITVLTSARHLSLS